MVEESGVKIDARDIALLESTDTTARRNPVRAEDRYSESPSPHASVFKRLKKNRSPSSRPRPRKGRRRLFNRWEDGAAYIRMSCQSNEGNTILIDIRHGSCHPAGAEKIGLPTLRIRGD
ncbi:hypothetical protein Tco_0364891 [Tanacetum coccineum]